MHARTHTQQRINLILIDPAALISKTFPQILPSSEEKFWQFHTIWFFLNFKIDKINVTFPSHTINNSLFASRLRRMYKMRKYHRTPKLVGKKATVSSQLLGFR